MVRLEISVFEFYALILHGKVWVWGQQVSNDKNEAYYLVLKIIAISSRKGGDDVGKSTIATYLALAYYPTMVQL